MNRRTTAPRSRRRSPPAPAAPRVRARTAPSVSAPRPARSARARRRPASISVHTTSRASARTVLTTRSARLSRVWGPFPPQRASGPQEARRCRRRGWGGRGAGVAGGAAAEARTKAARRAPSVHSQRPRGPPSRARAPPSRAPSVLLFDFLKSCACFWAARFTTRGVHASVHKGCARLYVGG